MPAVLWPWLLPRLPLLDRGRDGRAGSGVLGLMMATTAVQSSIMPSSSASHCLRRARQGGGEVQVRVAGVVVQS